MRSVARWTRNIHLTIALLIGLHFVLIASTGGLFIFDSELTDLSRWLRGWTSTPGDLGPERCKLSISGEFPDWDGEWIGFPSPQTPFYTAYLPLGSDFFWTEVFVDPGTGNIVGSVNNNDFSIEGILQIAIQLHIRLCAGETGRRLVDCSVILLLIELLTGLWLWWPGWKKLPRGFWIRRTEKSFLWLYDWHRVSGVLAVPCLLVMILTGLLWGFPEIMRPLVYTLCGEPVPASEDEHHNFHPPTPRQQIPPGELANLDEITAWMSRKYPEMRIQGIHTSPPDHEIATVSLLETSTGHHREVQFNRLARRSASDDLSTMPSPTFADQLTGEWAHSLHYGDFGGLFIKILYLIACLTVNLLYVTGIMMWWRKRQRRHSQKKAEVVAAN